MKRSVALIIMITFLAVFVFACHHHRRHRIVGPDMGRDGVLMSAATMSAE